MATNNRNKHDELSKLKRSLIQRTDRLKEELQKADEELRAVNLTIGLLGRPKKTREVAQESKERIAYYREFEGLTQVEGLLKIAKESGNNRFRIADAKKILLSTGLIKSKKNAANIVFTAIQRSEKFKRVAPGEYELILKPVSSSLTSQYEVLKKASA